MKSRLLGAVCAAVMSVISLPLDAATINFDDGTAPTSGPEPVNTYSADGIQVAFSDATYVSYSKAGIIGPDFPDISGNLGIQQYFWTGSFYRPVTATFSGAKAVDFVSIWAITTGGSTQSTTATLKAYDDGGNLLGQSSGVVGGNYPTAPAGADFARLLSFTAPNIAKIELTGFLSGGGVNGFHVTFDDLTFSAVPIPPALYLFASGLLGLVGVARRKAA